VSTTFWAENQVGGPYITAEESSTALAERAFAFPRLYDLMPVNLPGEVVLDYGCGPGHDTLLFCMNAAGHVFYYDISPLALDIVDMRLEMHGLENHASPVELHTIPRVDHIHCAGVLQHTEDPMWILKFFRRVLKQNGEARVSIYDGDRSKHSKSKVPITIWWKETEFLYMAHMAGFDAEQTGHYECSSPWRPDCYMACYRLTPKR